MGIILFVILAEEVLRCIKLNVSATYHVMDENVVVQESWNLTSVLDMLGIYEETRIFAVRNPVQ